MKLANFFSLGKSKMRDYLDVSIRMDDLIEALNRSHTRNPAGTDVHSMRRHNLQDHGYPCEFSER